MLRIEVRVLQSFILSVYKYKYKVVQGKGPLFWKVDSMGNCERKNRMNVCLILNGYRNGAVWISRPKSAKFCLCGWMKKKFTKDRSTLETNCSLRFWMLLPA